MNPFLKYEVKHMNEVDYYSLNLATSLFFFEMFPCLIELTTYLFKYWRTSEYMHFNTKVSMSCKNWFALPSDGNWLNQTLKKNVQL